MRQLGACHTWPWQLRKVLGRTARASFLGQGVPWRQGLRRSLTTTGQQDFQCRSEPLGRCVVVFFLCVLAPMICRTAHWPMDWAWLFILVMLALTYRAMRRGHR